MISTDVNTDAFFKNIIWITGTTFFNITTCTSSNNNSNKTKSTGILNTPH